MYACVFQEGIIFGKNEAVLMEGELIGDDEARARDKKNEPVNWIGAYWKPWFFTHARKALDLGQGKEQVGGAGAVDATEGRVELIPVYDYLMRHDRSMCMTMETVRGTTV